MLSKRRKQKSFSNSNDKVPHICYTKKKSSSAIDLPKAERNNVDITNLTEEIIHLKQKETIQAAETSVKILQSLSPFVDIIKHVHGNNFTEILREISFFIKYKTYEANRIINSFGDIANSFFVLIEGKIDKIVLKEKKVSIGYSTYLRYLGYLIVNSDLDVVKRVLELNWDVIPLVIEDLRDDYGKIDNITSYNSNNKIKYIKLKNIVDLFDENEKEKYANAFKEAAGKIKSNNNRSITVKEYVSHLSYYQKKDILFFEKETKIDITILEYYHVKSLKKGDHFTEIAMNNPYEKSKTTLISRTECFIGIIQRENYPQALKEAIDSNSKHNIVTILTTDLFINSISAILFNKKYYQYFVKGRKKKHTLLLTQNLPINNIYLIYKGIIDVSCVASMNDITNYIIHIYDMLTVKDIETSRIVNLIKEEDEKIKSRAKEIEKLDHFYCNEKSRLKLTTYYAKEISGLKDCLIPNKDSCIFTYEIKSDFVEYFSIDKEIYEYIKQSSSEVQDNEKKVLNKRIKIIIKRLYDLRQGKVKQYFEDNPDYFYFREYIKNIDQIDIYRDVLKIKQDNLRDKRRKCLSATINHFKHIKISLKSAEEKRHKASFLINSNLKGFFHIKKTNKSALNEFFLTNHPSKNKSNNNTFNTSGILSPNMNHRTTGTTTQVLCKQKILSGKKKSTQSQGELSSSSISQRLLRRYTNDNSTLIDKMIYTNCPFTSITAKKSLKRPNSAVNIFSYQENKKKSYLLKRNYSNIKNTRDVFTRFNCSKKYIFK